MAPCQSISTLPDHLLYKNRLQEHAQKSALPLPVYQTINEGFPHSPKFRSTVLVDGTKYTSNLTFSHRKAAEQDVAKQALDCIEKTIKGPPPITNLEFQDPMGYKSILHEFAMKSNRKIASYRTRTEGGLGPVFVSSVLFNSKVYTGQVSGSKKEAEQLAARAAILELLGSDVGNLLYEIVKSKGKLQSASTSVKELSIIESISPISFQPEIPLQQLRNIPQSINKLNSSDRVMSPPIMEEIRIMETQNWESGKRLNDFGRMMSSKGEEKNIVVETQNAESTKKVNPSCARMTSPNAGAKRDSETQNAESKKKVNPPCARMTSQHAGAKRASESQNVGPKKRVNNSFTRMTGPTAEGKQKMEAPPSLEQKNRFNSLGIMVGPNGEGSRKFHTQNQEPRKSFNSSGRMISPNKMEGTTRIQHQKFESKRKFYIGLGS